MKQLLLMRHGDAERGTPEMSDHARPLSAQGCAEAAEAGAWLRANGQVPDKILCSSALRTRQTLKALGLSPALTQSAEIVDTLYLASPGELLHCVQVQAEAVGRLLLIGHNPGIRDFCSMFVRNGEVDAQEAMSLGFKTGAIAGLSFSAPHWTEIPGNHGGKLEFYVNS